VHGVHHLEPSHNNMNGIFLPEHGSEITRVITGDPQKSQTKGRKKDGDKTTQNSRFKSELEESLDKLLVCHECREPSHNNKTCKKK